jgi:hypothetical protein
MTNQEPRIEAYLTREHPDQIETVRAYLATVSSESLEEALTLSEANAKAYATLRAAAVAEEYLQAASIILRHHEADLKIAGINLLIQRVQAATIRQMETGRLEP